MIFVTDNAGNVGTLKYKNILAKRILHPWNPDSLDLKEYAGTYYSKELFTKYKLDFSSGKLTMHHMRIGDFEIQPDPGGKDRFSPFLFGQITFLRDSKQKIMGFKYAGGRVRNLVFDKRN